MLSRNTKTTVVVAWVIFLMFFLVFNSEAAGLGSNYVGDGNVYVTITKNPHKASEDWGYVSPYTGHDIELGTTDEVGERRFVGYYEDEILQFWADGKNKRFETGHGKNVNESNKFVINGVQFFIESESAEDISVVNTSVEADCLDPDIDYYVPVNVDRLQYRYSTINDIWIMRIITSGSEIDWTSFNDGDITVEAIFNDTFDDACDAPYILNDTIEYFDCSADSTCSDSGIRAQYEGYRLTDYDYPTGQVTYPGKIRVTTEIGGINKHYLYINNVEDHTDLVGSIVNLKIKLYQGGELIQAFEGDGVMTTNVK